MKIQKSDLDKYCFSSTLFACCTCSFCLLKLILECRIICVEAHGCGPLGVTESYREYTLIIQDDFWVSYHVDQGPGDGTCLL